MIGLYVFLGYIFLSFVGVGIWLRFSNRSKEAKAWLCLVAPLVLPVIIFQLCLWAITFGSSPHPWEDF